MHSLELAGRPGEFGRGGKLYVTFAVVVLIALITVASPVSAETFYVATNGGTADQCDGLSNTPFGAGANGRCAWKHPFVALPPGGDPLIQGGDTLVIGLGSYAIGRGAPGAEWCEGRGGWRCVMAALPAGPSPSQPTRLLGEGWDRGCKRAPELWGTQRAKYVVNLVGSSNAEVQCLEITDHSGCIEGHCSTGRCPASEVRKCNRDSFPYGPWASFGIFASDASTVLLKNLNIHGLANRGVKAGRLSDWTIEDSKINANGHAGWDGDLGADDATSNTGTMLFRNTEIAWNGCTENWPSRSIVGCWGQGSGGYGDGVGTGPTGADWTFEDVKIHHNTSDGLDLLYSRYGGTITLNRVYAHSNAGNQVKTRGDTVVMNSIIHSNCGFFDGRYATMLDHCRALGATLVMVYDEGDHSRVINSSISGEGNCLVSAGCRNCSDITDAKLEVLNSLLVGFTDYTNVRERACYHFAPSFFRPTLDVTFDGNLIWNVKHDACPREGDNICGSDPMMLTRDVDRFFPRPISHRSPVVDAAKRVWATNSDFAGVARTLDAGPDIGAIELKDGVHHNGFER